MKFQSGHCIVGLSLLSVSLFISYNYGEKSNIDNLTIENVEALSQDDDTPPKDEDYKVCYTIPPGCSGPCERGSGYTYEFGGMWISRVDTFHVPNSSVITCEKITERECPSGFTAKLQ